MSPEEAQQRDGFELEFLYLDPVLSEHMESQSLSFIGRGVLEFVHPSMRLGEFGLVFFF
jgi:hypothetical protein